MAEFDVWAQSHNGSSLSADCSNIASFAGADRCAALAVCQEDSWLPWHWLMNCTLTTHMGYGTVATVLQALFAIVFFFAGAHLLCTLLAKVASMLFAPPMQEICDRCGVWRRTSAVTFIALANGAPDLASSSIAFREGKLDMAYGSLVGAGCFVCMLVVGIILRDTTLPSIAANGAFLRDALAYLIALAALLALGALGGGFTLLTCYLMAAFYFCDVGLVIYFDWWHNSLDRHLPSWLHSALASVPWVGPPLVAWIAPGGGFETLGEDFGEGFSEGAFSEGGDAAVGAPLLGDDEDDDRAAAAGSPDMDPAHLMRLAAKQQHDARISPLGFHMLPQAPKGAPEAVHPEDPHEAPVPSPTQAAQLQDSAPAPAGGPSPQESGALSGPPLEGPTTSPDGGRLAGKRSDSGSPSSSRGTKARASGAPAVSPTQSSSNDIRPSESASNYRPLAIEVFPQHAGGGKPPPQLTAGGRFWRSARNELKDYLSILLPAEDGGEVCEDGSVDDYAWFHWDRMPLSQRALTLATAPLMAAIRLCTPIVAASHYHPALLALAMALAPLAFAWLGLGWSAAWCVLWLGGPAAALGVATLWLFKDSPTPPEWLYAKTRLPLLELPLLLLAMSTLNIVIAVVFIQLLAGELVSALVAFGALTGCPEGLQGVMVAFANSMGDLATNVYVAKRLFERDGVVVPGVALAISACLNAQFLNLVLAPAIGAALRLHKYPEIGHSVPIVLSVPVWFMVGTLAAYIAGMVTTTFAHSMTLPRTFHRAAFAAFAVTVAGLTAMFAPQWLHEL